MENYQKELEKIISNLHAEKGTETQKPKLLIHACCGPCSSYVMEYLSEFFDITLFYYNPNIYPQTEYNRRLSELEDFLTRFPPALNNKVKLIKASYIPEEFYSSIGVRENPELAKMGDKSERCRRCYLFRMKKAYSYAAQNHFDYFCTTLSISRFKSSEKINACGKEIEVPGGPKWLPSDFKKNRGFERSLELSTEYGLQRQDYCGCVYSIQRRKEYTAKAKESAAANKV